MASHWRNELRDWQCGFRDGYGGGADRMFGVEQVKDAPGSSIAIQA